ncbi:MAG: hypothetical protein O7D30_12220, partial [Rickettsia endosymbiont of Ixodes persulcatus]|nr:hypothetical protein [Rickettsia endosymbiont of Ixodes persulcatus]
MYFTHDRFKKLNILGTFLLLMTLRGKPLPLILFTYIHLPKATRVHGESIDKALPRAVSSQASAPSFSVFDVPTILPLL